MRPSISKSCVATIPRHSIPPCPREIPVPAIREIPAYRSIRQGCASNAFRLTASVDAGTRVSSVTTLTISGRVDVPTLLQRLADLRLTEPFLLRQILSSVIRLPVFRHEFRGFHVVRFLIDVVYLVFLLQKFFWMSMVLQTSGH